MEEDAAQWIPEAVEGGADAAGVEESGDDYSGGGRDEEEYGGAYEGEEVVEIRLYPIELGWEEPRSQRGTPRIAPEALGRKIIEHLAELSRPFGTEIRYEGGVGVWHR